MPVNRRELLLGAGLAAAGGLLDGVVGHTARGWGRSDPAVILKEEVEGKKAVAVLADLERRVLVEPSDLELAFRTVHGAHATIKPLTYWAGLQQGVIDPDTPYECIGDHCPFGGHGRINAFEAVWRSCNGFFIDLSYRLNRDRWLELLRAAGYGRVTALGGPEELAGGCPERIDSEEAARVLAAYGTGVMVTPVQQLLVAARFANGGRSFPLGGLIVDAWPEAELARIELVRRAWRMHALKGSGQSVDRKSFPVGSRTGSARGSGWYLAFGPFDSPRYVLVVHVGAPAKDPGYPIQEAQKIGAAIFRRLV